MYRLDYYDENNRRFHQKQVQSRTDAIHKASAAVNHGIAERVTVTAKSHRIYTARIPNTY